MSTAYAEWLRSGWDDPAGALGRIPPGRAGPHLRLVRALAQQRGGVPLGRADLVSLVRAVLRQEAADGWYGPPLVVPGEVVDRIGVTEADWARASVSAVRRAGGVSVSAGGWAPGWLDTVPNGVDFPLYHSAPLRRDVAVPADPVLRTRLGYEAYQSAAQREFARAVLTAPPGATVVVNLPTGCGKTVCGLLPAVETDADLPGVTPFVVPTVALMLDLERRVRSGDPHHRSAYRPDEAGADEVRLRVAAGIQGPVFVSPEALAGSLRGPLLTAARYGHLRAVVVDEAHMVGAWGDDFRPAFQRIADVRRELLQAATAADHPPFATVLLSATLTAHRLRQLDDLFGDPGPVRVAHAVRLRPEPAYHVTHADDDAPRRERVLEAVRHLPRPLILYAVKRADAERWRRDLQADGFERVGLMHGGTPDDQRRRLLGRWERDECDVVVATAAFGLGVDKADVRAVVHAALPESVDRFYQEVGRGGRDGYACLSLLVWQRKDWGTVRAIGGPTVIGEGRGRERWEGMWRSAVPLDPLALRYRVDLSARPSARAGDIDLDSDEHRKWNLRTLLLLARGGCVELDWSRRAGDHSEDAEGGSPDAVAVRLLRPYDADGWWAAVEPVRVRVLQPVQESVSHLERLLGGGECVADVLADCYRSDDPEVSVVKACGGCRRCRADARDPWGGGLRPRHTPPDPWPAPPVGPALADFLAGRNAGVIFYRKDRDEPVLPAVLGWLLAQGVTCVTAPAGWRLAVDDWLRANPGRAVFADTFPPPGVLAGQPAAVVVAPGGGTVEQVWPYLLAPAGATVALLPDNCPQPDHPARRLSDVWTGPRLTPELWKDQYEE